MKTRVLFFTFILWSLLSSLVYAATTIDFDDGSQGDSVGNQYSVLGITFGNAKFVSTYGLPGSSGLIGIASESTGYNFDIANAVVANFSTGFTSVSITGIDIGGNGLRMDAYDNLGTLVGSDDWDGGTGEGTGEFQTLTISDPLIFQIVIYQLRQDTLIEWEGVLTPEGVILDNLVFETSAVPVPTTAFVFIVGLLGLTGIVRYQR